MFPQGSAGAVLLDASRRAQKEQAAAQEKVREAVPRQIHPSNLPGWEKLSKLQRGNQELLQQLASMGIGINIDVMSFKWEILMNVLFPGDTKEGQAKVIQIETTFEKMVNDQLTAASKQALQQVIDSGREIPPEHWNALAAAAGMAGLAPRSKKA